MMYSSDSSLLHMNSIIFRLNFMHTYSAKENLKGMVNYTVITLCSHSYTQSNYNPRYVLTVRLSHILVYAYRQDATLYRPYLID